MTTGKAREGNRDCKWAPPFPSFYFALKERPDFLSMIEWSRFPLDPDNYEHAQTERKKKDLCRHTYIYLKCKW